MLAVILKILQIIGIVLLCILGLVLLVAVLAVCLPIKYRISASKHEDTELNAHFKLTYFFRILRIMADYDEKLKIRAKILWFTVFSMDLFDKDENSESGTGEDEEPDEILAQMDAEYEDEFADDTGTGEPDAVNVEAEAVTDEEPSESSDAETEEDYEDTEDSDMPDQAENFDPTGDESGEDSENDHIPEDEDFFSKIKLKFRSICDKIESARSEYRYYRNVINSNEAHYALRKVKKATGKVLTAVLPRRIHADVVFGFSTPDLTGKVYGLYWLIRKRFDKKSLVTPDFDCAVFTGDVEAKGHFRLITFIGAGLSVLVDKNVRKIYRSFKKHNSKGGDRDDKEKSHETNGDKEKMSA